MFIKYLVVQFILPVHISIFLVLLWEVVIHLQFHSKNNENQNNI